MQPEMSHQAMGYDRASIVFSPDGRLLQVEYARKTVRQGPSAIGMVCKDGVLVLADKRIVDRLIVPNSIEKVFQIDDHICAVVAGIISDGRVLIEKAQVMAQQHRITFDEPMETRNIVKEICNIKQLYTQVGGARPFGVSILFAGVNHKPHIFVTDPTGIFFEFKATAIGEGETELKEILDKEYNENISIQEGIKLSLKAMKRVLGKEFDLNRISGGYIKLTDKKFKKLTKEDLKINNNNKR